MIRAVALLSVIVGAFAIPVSKDYPRPGCGPYGCSNIPFNGQGIVGGLNSGVNDIGFEARFFQGDGGNSAAASAAASGFNAAASASAATNQGLVGHQGVIPINHGFNAGFIGGNSAAASAAASGLNAAASAAAATNRGFSGHQGVVGLNNGFNAGVIGVNQHIVRRVHRPAAYQVPAVHYPSGPVFNGVGGSSAAASVSSANMGPGIGGFNPILIGQNPGAAAASAAASAGAASAAAAASSANLRSGMGGVIGPQFTGHLNGPVVQPFHGVPYPVGPVIGQNPGAAAAAAGVASSNGAASASAAASGSQGFIGGGILQGGSPRIINSNIVPGRKVY